MARANESATQRLQVGLVGLLAVLIFVSIASMILNRADGPAAAVATDAKDKRDASAGTSNADEPLVELGVTPVVPDQPDKQNAAKSAATGQKN